MPYFYEDGKIKQQHSYLNSKLDVLHMNIILMANSCRKISISKCVYWKRYQLLPIRKNKLYTHRNSRGQYDGANERYSEEGKYCLNPSIKTENKFLFKPGMKWAERRGETF